MKLFSLSYAIALMLTASAVSAQTLSLQQIIETGMNEHPSVQFAQQNFNAAKQGVEAAEWQYYPSPSVQAEQAGAGVKSGGKADSTTLRLQQPIYSFGKISSTIDQAKAQVGVSSEEIKEAQWNIGLESVDFYGQWYAATLKLDALSKSIKTHHRMKAMMERRVEQGLSPNTDLTLVESRLAAVNAEFEAAKNQKEIALASLSQILGREIKETDLTIEDAPMIKGQLAQLQESAKEKSPIRSKLLEKVKLAASDVEVAKTAPYPELYARAEYQNGASNVNPYHEDTRVYFGVQASLGSGLSFVSKVNQAKAKQQAATYEVSLYERDLMQEVSTQYSNYVQTKDRLLSLAKAQDTADQISQAWDRQFVTGKKSWLDVMNAARELAQTETLIADSKAALLTSAWKLKIMTQTYAN